MLMPPENVLEAVAVTLRRQVGPGVADPFVQTQAFMAAVILEKLAGQLRAAHGAAEAEAIERRTMLADLDAAWGDPPQRLGRAAETLAGDGTDASWSALLEALYADREALGDRFEPLLTRIRAALRSRLDRTLAYAS